MQCRCRLRLRTRIVRSRAKDPSERRGSLAVGSSQISPTNGSPRRSQTSSPAVLGIRATCRVARPPSPSAARDVTLPVAEAHRVRVESVVDRLARTVRESSPPLSRTTAFGFGHLAILWSLVADEACSCCHRPCPARQSMSSSARSSIGCGIVRRIALAVFDSTTSSSFLGSCTGRSPGFAPLRILST